MRKEEEGRFRDLTSCRHNQIPFVDSGTIAFRHESAENPDEAIVSCLSLGKVNTVEAPKEKGVGISDLK